MTYLSSAPTRRAWLPRFRSLAVCLGLILTVALLAGCGSSSASSTFGPINSSLGPAQSSSGNTSSAASSSSNSVPASSTPSSSSNGGPPYLVKALQVTIQVKDTRAAAATILAWIMATDTKSTTRGQQYTDLGDGVYNVTVQVSVQATLYPQVEQYLLNYPSKNGGTLLSLQETVQDVTNDYINTQAQIVTLQTEHQRLLALLGQASSLNDILTLDQQLTTVEGQLQQIEAHQQALVGEVTFYNVTVNLQSTGLPTPPVTHSGFSFGGTLHDAWNAALVFAGWLAVVAIWLVVFSIFALPVLAVILLIRAVRRRRIKSSAQVPAPVTSS
ncbi:MAG: DUF4349 domain-containing protein [Ktedonobacterales bacterium]